MAAQQTGWHFVAVMRRHLPNAVGGVAWYDVDDNEPRSNLHHNTYLTVAHC